MTLRTAVLLLTASAAIPLLSGCGGVIGGTFEDAQSRVRGVDLSYDILNLWSPAPSFDPALFETPLARTPDPAPLCTLWRQTADGIVHREDVTLFDTAPDPLKLSGLLWYEVTPLGVEPRHIKLLDLGTMTAGGAGE